MGVGIIVPEAFNIRIDLERYEKDDRKSRW